ncbi:MAG TPA: NADH-quinone oxidoreductase subunit C [Amaricoccus sp.]|uniref:hydrogenase large subunit n=2 Tax=Amaricoccus TaxID=56999 RepID=UPI002BBFB51F|nr:hydrogenase expression protein HypE [Amaricoccus sp.]HRO12634.1 NADH-quinone oxidoreductase subunit C [Amaricoccus sp.]
MRTVVSAGEWRHAARALAAGEAELFGLWASTGEVHMALRDPAAGLRILSVPVSEDRFPSVGRHHAAAQRLERAIGDLYGYTAEGAADDRPWLDHGRWGVRHPLGEAEAAGPGEPYAFLPVKGESLHRVLVGPVHAGVIEPGHFRFTVQGETVVRLEQRLGYTHKGVEGLMRGATLARAAGLAGRVSGDSTVAYAWAFAQAVEAALGVAVPERALWLRLVMAELERLANHLGDIGAICNDAGFAMMLAQCGALRERVLRASMAAFGHRMMRDRVVPGGVAADLDAGGVAAIRGVLGEIGRRFPGLVRLYDETASLQDRTVGAGRVAPALAARFAAGGYVGRAAGRDFDARRDLVYPPYDRVELAVPVLGEGDVDARVRVRIGEVEASLGLVAAALDRLPEGPLRAEVPVATEGTEGLAVVEGFRGDILVWLRIGGDGLVERCHLRDPSWFQWPLLEAVVEGNIIADFPLCNKSFNCAYSGHDL